MFFPPNEKSIKMKNLIGTKNKFIRRVVGHFYQNIVNLIVRNKFKNYYLELLAH